MSGAASSSRAAGLFRDAEGGMYAEAIIVLPMLILVFSLILFVNEGYDRAIEVGGMSRGAGWGHACNQCQGSVASPVQQTGASGSFAAHLGGVAALVRGAGSVIRYQPLLLAERLRVITFQIESNRYQISETIDRPAALGGGARLGHQIELSCDEQHDEVNLGRWIGVAYATQRFGG